MAETDVSLQTVLKVASRCNLNCSYCYVYHRGDESWRDRPAIMPEDVFQAAVQRILSHIQRSRQPSVTITFHGGEPCLAGVERFDRWCAHLKTALQPETRLKLCLQTNGTLIDDAWAEVIGKHRVHVGLSIDGMKSVHDEFRVDHQGHGSYDDTVRGLRLLRTAGIPVQILSVVQFGADGVRIHRHFEEFGASIVHYLLPDFNHDSIGPVRLLHGATPCADFLIPIFDEWLAGGGAARVNPFHTIARMMMGGETNADTFGNRPLRFVFVETGGEIEILDVLRTCAPGMTSTGLHVLRNEFRDLAAVSNFHRDVVFQGRPLPSGCRTCPEQDTCAGGYLPHRYSTAQGFDNPSVWCGDLLKLFTHIRERLGLSVGETELRRRALAELTASLSIQTGALRL